MHDGAGRAPDLAAALRGHAQRFARCYPPHGASRARVRLFFAPGRVNLMGAHLDYNGGPVMPLAIDRGTFLAVRERPDRRVRLRSTLEDGELVFDPADPPASRHGRWYDYPLGVLLQLAPPDLPRPGLDVLYGGNLPIGAGLSSSASICVGTAHALDVLWSLDLGPQRRVEAALSAEREFVGVQCGIMDPYAVGLARANQILWLDCKDASTAHFPLDARDVRVAVADTGVRRELAQGMFNRRVAEARAAFEALAPHVPGATCLRDVPLEVLERHADELAPLLRRRATHVLREVERTFSARRALQAGDLAAFGRLMLAAHRSLRELYEVSVAELDLLVDASAEQEGVFGARLTGAGFGGCVAVLLSSQAVPGALERVAEAFERRFGRRPTVEVFGGDEGPREVDPDAGA